MGQVNKLTDTPKLLDSEGLSHYSSLVKSSIEDSSEISDNFTVQLGTGGSVGGYKTGDVISAGTAWESIIKQILAKRVPPTYVQPSLSIYNHEGTPSGNYEYGTVITPKMRVSFNKNDAGTLTNISITKGSEVVAQGTISPLDYNSEISFNLTEEVSFNASCSYGEGPIKKDNLGDDYPTGHIQAGTKSSSVYKYTPYRQGYFYGVLATSSEEAPMTSDIIRGGAAKSGTYAPGNLPLIEASSVDSRKRIFVACPANKTGVVKVIMPSAMGADCTENFVKMTNTIEVKGANNTPAAPYNVWVYEPAYISDDQTFTVSLG